jgi:Fic family protein
LHAIEYEKAPKKLLSPGIVSLLAELHEYTGKKELFIEANIDELTPLLEVAKIQSTDASNRIEGSYTTDKRLAALVREKSAPRNRNEEEIAGYRDVLATIHESYDYINLRPNIILQLHKQLYSFAKSAPGGKWKNADNYIAETDAAGNEKIRFKPVPAFQTPDMMASACDGFNRAMKKETFDPLLLIPMFILDFLCIHPFNDGNGRMSRLLTLLLYYRSGYLVGKYISIEKLIEGSKETYYEALGASSAKWHENRNNYEPFLRYCLGVLLKAYGEFEDRVEHLRRRNISKPDRIRAFAEKQTGTFSKKEVMEACPDISRVTVERALTALVKEGFLVKIGGGPASRYAKH